MKTKYDFTSEGSITATLIDDYYLWIAFQGSDNECVLKKVSAFDPELTYFNLTITASKITKMYKDATYLYLAFDDSVYIGARFSKNNPLITYSYLTKPTVITERAVDVIASATKLYFLTPGESGAYVNVIEYNSSAVYVETHALSDSTGDITEAKKFDIDESGFVWIVSEPSDIEIVKLNSTTGLFNKYTIT